MFNGGKIIGTLKEDIDRKLNPEKWNKIDRKRKLNKLNKLNKNYLFKIIKHFF